MKDKQKEEVKEKRRRARVITDRSRAREIVSEIIRYGVNDAQIIHIMNLLALNLEDNKKMKEIVSELKKFDESINTEDSEGSIISVNTNNKVILN